MSRLEAVQKHPRHFGQLKPRSRGLRKRLWLSPSTLWKRQCHHQHRDWRDSYQSSFLTSLKSTSVSNWSHDVRTDSHTTDSAVVTPEQLASFGRFDLPQQYVSGSSPAVLTAITPCFSFTSTQLPMRLKYGGSGLLNEQVLETYDFFPGPV